MSLPATRNTFLYHFHSEDGDFDATYAEYLRDPQLQVLVNHADYRRIVLGRNVFAYRQDTLADNRKLREGFEGLVEELRRHWLWYFCPNSDEQLAFINDNAHDVCGIIAPNRVGKTTVAIAKGLLGGAIPTDADWPVFAENGVKRVEFKGKYAPIKIGLATYQWQLMKNVMWPRLRALLPAEELGVYGPDHAKHGSKRRREPQWINNPRIELACGTILQFFVYEQDQQVFESDAFNEFWWDEQGKEHLFDAVDERTRTLKGRHLFSLTPHKVEGRPDTGGGGWLEALFTGTKTKGHSVRMYGTGLQDVPDWIYPESEKKKAYTKWIDEPTAHRDIKTLREGRARVFGEWHRTSGLVLDEWDPAIHVVDDFEIPDNWTRYRAMDHGITNPTVCLWIAVSPPEGDWGSWIAVYRELYTIGRTISENVAKVISMSGNERRRVHEHLDAQSGNIMAMWEEVQSGERYAKTVLDSRSFALRETLTGKPYGSLYRMSGLPVQASSGKFSEHWIPVVKELLAVNYDKLPYTGGDKKGASHIMFFRSCTNIRREVEGWAWEPNKMADGKNPKELPRKKDDHGCNALGYAVQIPLRWRGDIYTVVGDDERRRMMMQSERYEGGDNGEYRPI